MTNKREKEITEKVWFQAQSIRQLVDAGYDLMSVRDAVLRGDMSLLKLKG